MRTLIALAFIVAINATTVAFAATPGVPFIGRFGEIFAGPDDPFPGEDVRAYCSTAAKQYSTFMYYRDTGMPKDLVKKAAWKALTRVQMDKVEIQRYGEQIDRVFDMDEPNDTQTWVDYGQSCMDRRLGGSWFTYDWKNDKDYPKPYDPYTQELLPKAPQ